MKNLKLEYSFRYFLHNFNPIHIIKRFSSLNIIYIINLIHWNENYSRRYNFDGLGILKQQLTSANTLLSFRQVIVT